MKAAAKSHDSLLDKLDKELQVQDATNTVTPPPNGFVTKRIYDDLLHRFHTLQYELSDREVELAQTMLQLAIERRNGFSRLVEDSHTTN